ncbi:hypothetical protein BRADI_3g14778v3 [Brachypodium distachyon]|uniref:Reverse transcriptase zinc-binding domain-containing protein n=1 Tax=Brachypodium distachyon TaxID=15368 RepID=A0A2K2CX53_BRADI|nr:hypothetical protein BRADI_3g14778v3 [Brachypodium distachyon]
MASVVWDFRAPERCRFFAWLAARGRRGRKDFLTAVTLVFWIIWRHCNHIVFNGVSSSVHWVLATVREELDRWCSAGLFRNRGIGSAFAASRLMDRL